MSMINSSRFRSLLITMLLSLVLLGFSGAALAEVVGRLSRVEGAVDVMPGGQLPAVAAKEGSQVQTGDFVRTKSNARAELTFNDGSVIKIAPRSRIDVAEYSASGRKLGLPRGKVQATVIPAAGGASRSFEIRTPNAIAGVRGTSFYVYHQANVTGVAVLEGVVHTASLAMPSNGVTLAAGTATTVSRRNAPTPPRPVTDRELNSHQNDVTPSGASAGDNQGAASGTGGTSGDSSASGATTTASSSGQQSTDTASQSSDTSSQSTDTASQSSDTASQSSDTSSGSSTTSGGTSDAGTAETSFPSAISDPVQTAFAPDSYEPPATPETYEPPPTTTTPDTEVTVPIADTRPEIEEEITDPPPTEPPPVSTAFSSQLAAGLMSRSSDVDPASNLLTIINDPGFSINFKGVGPLWAGGEVTASLTGSYPALPLQQPNHYWLGHFFSETTANHTTADGGGYWGYFGGMSLDGYAKLETSVSALYLDPDGKIGIMQGVIPGAFSASEISGTGTVTLTEMNAGSGLSPESLTAGWWDSAATDGAVVEVAGPVLTGPENMEIYPGGYVSTGPETGGIYPEGSVSTYPETGGTYPTANAGTDTTLPPSYEGNIRGRNVAEGFLLGTGLGITGSMSHRGDVLRLAYLAADPSFGIWSRESFGSYQGGGSHFVLISNAEWGSLDANNVFNMDDAIQVVSLGSWQEGALTARADGVWGNLESGSVRILTGTLTGSANPGTSTFGAVSTGSFIDLSRFLSTSTLAAQLGFPTIVGSESFTLSGTSAAGSVNLGAVTFYSRNAGDPVSLWVAQNVTGSYSGELQHQNFSLMNGDSPSVSSIMGNMHITGVSGATGNNTWLGSVSALGQTGASFGSEFDGIAAGSFTGTTFTGSAAGLSHPVTYYSRISSGLSRYENGGVVSYGNLDGVMGGMSLWDSNQGFRSGFQTIGFLTAGTTLSASDFVMSAPIRSLDLPSGTATTADGGAYQGHLVASVSTAGGNPGAPGVMGLLDAISVDPSGNVGILHGRVEGSLDPGSNVWMGGGQILPVTIEAATGVTAATLASGGIVTTSTTFGSGTPFGTTAASGTFFSGLTFDITAWASDSFTRSYLASFPDWGIGQFGLYASYSSAPAVSTPWWVKFSITDGSDSFGMMGGIEGRLWDTNTGQLNAQTRAVWADMLPLKPTEAPMTGIFIGETVGTFNPASLQAMTSGIWLETGKFLEMVLNNPSALLKLNIPAFEVGKADFKGAGTDFDVYLHDLAFFAPVAGGRPQVFATDNITGNYLVASPGGSATLMQVPGSGAAVSGIAPVFTINQWDTGSNKWSGTLDYYGSTGAVAGHPNIQMMGVANGRIGGGVPGTFTGTAAGLVH